MPYNPKLFDDRMGFANLFNMDLRYIMAERHFPNATLEVDMKENTDFGIYVSADCTDIRYATRVRSHNWFINCSDEFTIRDSHESGARTEFDKIIEDPRTTYDFYSFASIDEWQYQHYLKYGTQIDALENRHLVYWFIGKMDALREFLKQKLVEYPDRNDDYWTNRRKCVGGNGDTFLVFKQSEVPGFVIDSSAHDGWYFDENKRLWTRQKPFVICHDTDSIHIV